MPFEPGQSGNPAGRPKGAASGRMAALAELAQLLNEVDARLHQSSTPAFHAQSVRLRYGDHSAG